MGNESLHREDRAPHLEEAMQVLCGAQIFPALSPLMHTSKDSRLRLETIAFPKFAPQEQGEGPLYSQPLVPSPNRVDLPCPQDLLLPRRSLLSGHTMVKQLQMPASVYTASAF